MDLDELVFHPWTMQGPRTVPTFVGGSGSHVIDADGRRYLDFSSQLVFTSLGHQHPRIVAAIKEQADRLCTLAPGHASDIRSEAARLIVDVAPEGLGHVLFTTGGTEAIEHAVRMARLHTGRPKVLAAYRSYHGSTTTSIHLTGDPRRWASDTGAAGVVHFFGPFLYRSAFGSSSPEEECERALAHLEQVILLEGPSTIAALILEPVTGSSGVIVPPAGYLRGVRDLCTRHGIVFIADEILVGFGRTGAWFARRPRRCGPGSSGLREGRELRVRAARRGAGRRPDLRDVHQARLPGGHDLQRAPARLRVRGRRDRRDARRGHRRGGRSARHRHPRTRTHEACREPPLVGDVRGIGGLWTVELVRDRQTKEPLVPVGATGEANAPMAAFIKACLGRDLLPLVLGNRIHVAPPLNVSDDDAATGLAILDEALAEADSFLA